MRINKKLENGILDKCEMLVYVGASDNHTVNGQIFNVKETGHAWGTGEENSEIFTIYEIEGMALTDGIGYIGKTIDEVK